MILLLSTADSELMFIGLAQKGKLLAGHQLKARAAQSEKLILEIDKLLKSNKINLRSLKAVGVVSGPASFTALRIGVATANVLAWGLNIPVIGLAKNDFTDFEDLAKKIHHKAKSKKFSKIVLPFYGLQANITKSKK